MAKKDMVYLVVETKPKNKSEFDSLGINTRAEYLRTSLDGTKFILKWDSGKKKNRPAWLDEAKTKTYTHEAMLKEIRKKNSDWQDNG